MSSRASARFPTALAGTKPCAEAWEGLRRGLGGTAVLGSSGFTAVVRAWGQPPMEPVLQTVLWGQPVQLFTPPTPGE